jgi:Pilus formation protein N terminal region
MYRTARAVLLLLPLLFGPAHASEPLIVFIDQATVAKLPERVATIVIGNPLIADITIQPGGTMVVTGKGYGETNVLALDRGGNVLMEKPISVQGPRDEVVVVYRGIQRETYSCQPHCERRIMLGDGPDFFNLAIGQTGVRNGLAQGSAAGQAAR